MRTVWACRYLAQVQHAVGFDTKLAKYLAQCGACTWHAIVVNIVW